MTAPAAYLYDTDSPRVMILRGDLRAWLQENRIPAQRSTASRGWFIRHDRVADLVARLEHAGWRVVVKSRTLPQTTELDLGWRSAR